MWNVLTAASHAATILCALHREYLHDRGERCAANGMTYEGHRRIGTITAENCGE